MTSTRAPRSTTAADDGEAQRRRPGRPRALSEGDVIDAALAIADRDGVAGLSMRGLARELGVPIMTLYGYVPNKRALDALVADAVLAEVTIPEPDSGSWDRRLHTMLCEARRVLVKRPRLAAGDTSARGSAVELVHGGSYGREATRLATAVVGLLEEGGFGPEEQLTCFRTLFIYVTGYTEPDEHAPLSTLDRATDGPGPQEAFAVGLEALIHGLVHLLRSPQDGAGERRAGPRVEGGRGRSGALLRAGEFDTEEMS